LINIFANLKDLSISLNGTYSITFKFLYNISEIQIIRIYSNLFEVNSILYLNSLNVSWEPEYNDLIYTTPYIISHLLQERIYYYIQTKNDNYYKLSIEKKSININKELTSKLYSFKLYEYENLAIFSLLSI